jgi:CspA family cold shock protein
MGTIAKFNASRGFGFIKRKDGDDLFFHISSVSNPDMIEVGRGVNYSVEETPKGTRAINVTIL